MLGWGALSAAIAAACGYADFNTNVSQLRSLSVLSLRSYAVWVFLCVNGALAFGAWWWLISDDHSWIANLIVVKDAPPIARAVLIGLVVPTVMKAGAFYISGNGFGIEYLYNLFRGWATDHYIDTVAATAGAWVRKRANEEISAVDALNLLNSVCARIRDNRPDGTLERVRVERFLADTYKTLKPIVTINAEYGNVNHLEDQIKITLANDVATLSVEQRRYVTQSLLTAAIKQTNLSFVQRTFVAQLPPSPPPWWKFWNRFAATTAIVR